MSLPLTRFPCLYLVAMLMVLPSPAPGQSPAASARDMTGLWAAKLRFGPDIRGTLRVEHGAAGWSAEIAGRTATATVTGAFVVFDLPDGAGGFRGRMSKSRQQITGHWVQAPTTGTGGRFASPATLVRAGKSERWEGVIDPLEDQFTMYLRVHGPAAADGTMPAFLKNPERNIGFFTRVASLERDGDVVRLRSKGKGRTPGNVLAEGRYQPDDGVLSIPLRGGTYDFERVAPDAASDFYARSRPDAGSSYRYRVPPALNDGWPVATPEDAGMSREALEKLVRAIIDIEPDSVSTLEIHAVLIARHGKLVLEEYFHGEHRDKPHDTRSASKSVMSVLAGAAIQSGVKLRADSPVYEVMNGGVFPAGLEPRKRALTLEHLLTMSSGLDADDNDENSPGQEDRVADADVEDVWSFTLALNMVRDPGERAVYASLQPNLAGGVVRHAAGRPLTDIFHDSVAEPMQIRRYWLNLMQTGEPYMGGGMRLVARDFMKFGQLLLNDGTWGGRRVLSGEWVRKSMSPLYPLGKRRYGYLWWLIDYPHDGRTLTACYAGGNGGQVVMAVPDLDLVITFFGGNYADRIMFKSQNELVPQYVLPAVLDE